MADAWMPGARCIRARVDGGQLGGGAPRVVWLTLGADPRTVSVWSAAQRLNQEDRPCHLVWDPLTGDIAQLLPIVRAGCALGMPEYLDYEPDRMLPRPAGVNREGRLCVQIGVLGSPREPFTSFQMIGLASILAWLDSWQIPRRWPAGQPVPYRQLTRPRSRALWARGGHFGASQVPECDNIGPGGIDIEHLTSMDVSLTRELREPICTNGSPIQLTAHATHELSGLSAAVLSPLASGRLLGPVFPRRSSLRSSLLSPDRAGALWLAGREGHSWREHPGTGRACGVMRAGQMSGLLFRARIVSAGSRDAWFPAGTM